MRMVVRARRARNAKEFRRLEQIYLAEAELSTREIERDGLLKVARDCGYAADKIERRALIRKAVVLLAIAALALFAVLYIP
ncbi:hypothetical protein [Bradyrhizobium sp. Cp5.3]|nr:hypothetical protein [Bradyrhizobium sp. Cp5.3]